MKEIKLATEKSVPCDHLRDFSQLWYGREKIGKTEVAALFDDPYFLLCEPGGKSVSMYKTEINDWEEFQATRRALSKTKKFGTVVIDTIDIAAKYCADRVMRRLGIKHPSEADWGKGWSMIHDEFQLEMSRLLKLGRGVIFISHDQEKEIKRAGQTIHRTVPTLSNQARSVIEPMVDIWAHFEYNDDGDRQIRLVGDRHVAAGHRLGRNHFKGVEVIPMGDSPEEAYQNYISAFNNALTGGSAAALKATKGKPTIKLKRSK